MIGANRGSWTGCPNRGAATAAEDGGGLLTVRLTHATFSGHSWMMSVVAGATGEALADLASALTAASTSTDAVVEMAAKAAASLIGDAGGVRLARQDGRYDPVMIHHADADLARRLAATLTRPEARVDEGFSATMRATRRPVVLPAPSDDQLRQLATPDRGADEIRAALLAPLVSGQTYLGYLAFVRTTPGRTYAETDVALAHDVAAMT